MPETTIYESPIVFIFSTPYVSVKSSNWENMSFKKPTIFSDEIFSDISVKLTMSANKTDISGLSIDMVLILFFSFSAIDLGIILWRSFSDLLRSCSRKIEYIPIGNPKTSKLPTILLTPMIDSVKSLIL